LAIDAVQNMSPSLVINVKTWIQLGPLITYEGGTQVLGSLNSLLVWEPWGVPK